MTDPLTITPTTRKALIVTFCILIIIGIGVGGYYTYEHFKRQHDNKKPGDEKCAKGHRSCNGKCCASTYQNINGVCTCGCANGEQSCSASYNDQTHNWCCKFSQTCGTKPGHCS